MYDEKPTAEHRLAVCEGLLRKAEAEVARLREELVSRHEAAAYMAQRNRADAAEQALATERAAHEATKAELSACMKRSQHNYDCSMRDAKRAWAAEQRVAELEAWVEDKERLLSNEERAHVETRAALSSARELLVRVYRWCPYAPMAGDIAALLGAHPEPATPAATGAEPDRNVCWHCMVHLEPEEPPHCEQCPRYDCCDAAGCEEPGCTDRVAAEKERET